MTRQFIPFTQCLHWVKLFLVIVIISALGCFTATAAPLLTGMRVGFSAHVWHDIFAFEITNLSITQGNNTRLSTSLPTHITEPESTRFVADPSLSPAPIGIATGGSMGIGLINISYTITMMHDDWKSSTVTASNIPIVILGGELQNYPIDTINGNTTCRISAALQNGGQFI